MDVRLTPSSRKPGLSKKALSAALEHAGIELRTTASGLSVTTIRIATNDREQPEFHDVVLWRQQAKFVATYMGKGRLAYVEGRLRSRTWEAADGTKRRTVEVVAEKFKALTPRQAEAAA